MRLSLTVLGWGLLLYLWLPLLGELRAGLKGDANHPTVSLGRLMHPLVTTLRTRGGTLLGLCGLFLSWSGLQWHAQRRRAAAVLCAVTAHQLARSVRLTEKDLTEWQQAQRVVVQHDEGSGWIRSVICTDALLPLNAATTAP